MEFFRRAAVHPRKLGVFPGTFNPPTRAHIAVTRAALDEVDEVVFVLPRAFPHKPYEGAPFEDRVRMLEAALAGEPNCSIAASGGGLFLEIARECREFYGAGVELCFLCGRDAAERIINWDYGRPGAFLEQLNEYSLLVAPRRGGYKPAGEMGSRIRTLCVEPGLDEVSASAVRDRIASGEPWEHLVPEAVVPLARSIYGEDRH